MIRFCGCALAAVVLMAVIPSLARQSDATKQQTSPMTPEQQARYAEISKRYAEAGAPGKQHADLARYLGEWDVALKFTPAPGQMTEARGKANFRWLVEGRWLIEEFETQWMGEPFKGFNLIGYDNLRKQYVTCWLDSASTSFIMARGDMDPAGELLTTFTQVDDLIRGVRDKTMRTTTRFAGPDTMIYSTQDMLWGQTTTTMEATYSRKR